MPEGQRQRADRESGAPSGKKLVDRAMAGIYLGPADPIPGHLGYFHDKERPAGARDVVLAFRHVSFNETVFPGVISSAILPETASSVLVDVPPDSSGTSRPVNLQSLQRPSGSTRVRSGAGGGSESSEDLAESSQPQHRRCD